MSEIYNPDEHKAAIKDRAHKSFMATIGADMEKSLRTKGEYTENSKTDIDLRAGEAAKQRVENFNPEEERMFDGLRAEALRMVQKIDDFFSAELDHNLAENLKSENLDTAAKIALLENSELTEFARSPIKVLLETRNALQTAVYNIDVGLAIIPSQFEKMPESHPKEVISNVRGALDRKISRAKTNIDSKL